MADARDLSALSPEEKRALLAELLARRAATPAALMWPLSHGQRALWFLHQLNPTSAAYNLAFVVRVRSTLDEAALARAIVRTVERHPALRSTITLDERGEPVQVVQPRVAIPLERVDVAPLDEGNLQRTILGHHRQPFDLGAGPLVRAALFTRQPDDHVLLLSVHHIAFDGWSLGIVADELRRLYLEEVTGADPQLPEIPFQYGDFVDWQRRMLEGSEGRQLDQYWSERLTPPLPVINLPADRQRPSVLSGGGGTCDFTVPADVVSAIDALGREEQAGLFATLLAAFQVLLVRYTGQDRILVGAPTAGRSRPEFDRIVGYFVNPVVLSADLGDDPSFRECVRRARDTVQGAVAHQDYPFPLLVERLHPQRDPSRSPVFQVMFNLQRASRLWGGAVQVPGDAEGAAPDLFSLEPYALPQEEGQFDLALDLLQMSGELVGTLRYSSDLFEADTARRMTRHLGVLLRAIAAEPDRAIGRLPILTDEERRDWESWNSRALPEPVELVVPLIEKQTHRQPGRVALTCGGVTLTYGEMDRYANRLAWRLRTLGVGPDVLVGIGLDRSVEMVVAVLAVLKAGGAYVPLDPAFPPRRLSSTVKDAGLTVLITEQRFRDKWPAEPSMSVLCMDDERERAKWDEREDTPPAVGAGHDLAYVIYTSGSTGEPKGVAVSRAAQAAFMRAMRDEPGAGADDTVVAVTTLSFDIAGLELLLPLTVGGHVVVATREETVDGQRLAALVASSAATIMQGTPATWRLLLNAGWEGSPGLKMLCGGEPLAPEMAAQLLARGASLWNMYGPTETTIWSSVERVAGAEPPISIGRPIPGTKMAVVDRRGQLLPVGVPGELYIGGRGVARGYWRRPDLTAQRFVADSLSASPDGPWYRTGDLARYLPDGRLECLGRLDDQVKVRGFRIELGDIEAALERHPAVQQAVASVQADAAGDRRLVAYVLPASGADEATASELRRFLRQELPDYMVPSLFMTIESIPLTANRKVDRRGLPSPFGQPRRASERIAPRTPVERAIASIWADVLGRPDVSVHDNFFDIGGHSLLSMEAIAAIEKRLGVRLHPAQFMLDTLEQISATCEQMTRTSGAAMES